MPEVFGDGAFGIGFAFTGVAFGAGPIDEHVQRFSVGERIELFDLDTTQIPGGGGVFRFTPMASANTAVTWRGNEYTPMACTSDGFELNGQTQSARPRLRVSNVGGLFGTAVIALGDLRGAIVTRYRTFKRFLDGQPDANPTAYMVPDVFIIQRKTTHTKEYIEWELSSPIDQENVFIPGRPVMKYVCTRRYRVWNPNTVSFDYSRAQCPFNGSQNGDLMYDQSGNPVADPAQDVCGRQDSDCLLRFPQPDNNGLPTWAFAGVGSISLG